MLILTGRPPSRASLAAAMVKSLRPSLLPNPPPMYSFRTRTLPAGIARARANPSRTDWTAWVESQTVSRSPSQTATEACVSVGWWTSQLVR